MSVSSSEFKAIGKVAVFSILADAVTHPLLRSNPPVISTPDYIKFTANDFFASMWLASITSIFLLAITDSAPKSIVLGGVMSFIALSAVEIFQGIVQYLHPEVGGYSPEDFIAYGLGALAFIAIAIGPMFKQNVSCIDT